MKARDVISEVKEQRDRKRRQQQAKEQPNGNGRAGISFVLKPFELITMSTAPCYLVKGLVPHTGIVTFWGEPKCGKSFAVFDLFMHVALGWSYRGRRVQQGPVVYLALEGGAGFSRRVEAWRQRHLAKHRDPIPFYLIDVSIDLIKDHAKLIAEIKLQLGGQVPVAVVVDTLNRALNGDENASADMGKFVRAADAVRAAFECLIAIIHHCGIQGSRPRGHSSLSGADEAQIAVTRDDAGNVVMTVEHMKDDESGAVIVSRLERVELGADDEGDPITSCIIVPAEGVVASKPKPKLPPIPKLALATLKELISEVGVPAPASNHVPQNVRVCSAILWRDNFLKAHLGDKPDTKRKAFVRAVDTLKDLGFIGIWSDWAWVPDMPDIGGTS